MSRMINIWRPDWDGSNGELCGDYYDDVKDEVQRIDFKGAEIHKGVSTDPPPEVIEKVASKPKPPSSSKCRLM